MHIYDSSRPNKISHYIPDPIPSSFSVSSVNYVSNSAAPYHSPQVIFLTFYAPDTYHIIIRYKPGLAVYKIGYCYRWHVGIRCYKQSRLYFSTWYIHKRFYYCHVSARINTSLINCSIENQHCMALFCVLMCLTSLSPLMDMFNLFLCLFYSWYIDPTLLQYFYLIFLKLLPCLVAILCFDSCNYIPVRQIYFTDYLHVCDRILKWSWSDAKKYPPFSDCN